MIPLVTKREPFIQLITDTVIEQGRLLLQCLNEITNSSYVRQTQFEQPAYNYNTTHSTFLPREIPEETWMVSLFISLFAFSSLYFHLTNQSRETRQPALLTALDLERLRNMPPQIQQKFKDISKLSALNTQLSIYHMFAGADFSGDAQSLDKELDNIMSRVNDELIDFFDGHPLQYNELFFNNAFPLFEEEPSRMISSNAAFIQLVALANKSDDLALRTRAHRLYASYMQLDEIARYTHVPDFGHSETGALDWTDAHANNYILLPTSYLKVAMLISQDTLERMMGADLNLPSKESFNLYNDECVPLDFENYPLAKFFSRHYSLFDECTSQHYREKGFADLLSIIMPGNEYIRELFFNARRQQRSAIKLTGADNARTLMAIFAPWLNFSCANEIFVLDENHCQNILIIYGLEDATPDKQAKCLLSLSAFFVKCAGDKIFGTVNESPKAIRKYALALMSKAYSLDRAIFKSGMTYWENIIIAAEDYPRNSEILAKIMAEHNKQQFPEMFAEIMPPAWYQ